MSSPEPGTAAPWRALIGGCLAIAALSLLLPSAPTYDPWSWLVWGREIGEGTLDTRVGPSWKPLPILFTTPFSLLGDGLAPDLWLVIARAGGLLGVALAFRLASRLAGIAAGVLASGALILLDDYLLHAARGNSEGLLVGLSLWAAERHLDGRHTSAFVLGLGAALLRPEVWPFWGLYGLWLAWRSPARRWLVGAAYSAIPLLWFLPEYIGSGDFFRAGNRAREPVPGSPGASEFPALEVLERAGKMVPLLVFAGAAVGVVTALRRREGAHDRLVLALGASTVALMIAVALMAEGGFSGSTRYVMLPIAIVCVLAGAGWVELVAAVRARIGSVAAIAAAAVLAVLGVLSLGGPVDLAREQLRTAEREARSNDELPAAVARAPGGAAAIRECGTIFTGRFQLPLVAWTLHVRLQDVEIFPVPPGTTIASAGSALSRDPRFPPAAKTERWSIGMACKAA